MRLVLIATYLCFIAACQQGRKYRYTLVQETTGARGIKIDTITTIRYYPDDATAYIALTKQFVAKYDTYNNLIEYGIHEPRPISFTIEDENGIDIRNRLDSSTKEKAARLLAAASPKKYVTDSMTVVHQSVAFGDLKFGLSEKAFQKLKSPHKEYFQALGTKEYIFEPSFDHNGELYMVSFDGLSKDASYLETEIYSEVENLISIVSAKYGEGRALAPFPTVLDLRSGFITWVREWNIGTKTILVGVGEHKGRATFYSTCQIYDQKRSSAYHLHLDSVESKTHTTESSKF